MNNESTEVHNPRRDYCAILASYPGPLRCACAPRVNKHGNCMSKASAVSPVAIAITPKLHSNPSDSMLITYHSSIATAFVQLKKACDYKSVQFWK